MVLTDAPENRAIRTARVSESRQTDDELSPDFLSSANRSHFMTARDCRRWENRFPVSAAIFSGREGIYIKMSEAARAIPRIRLWIKFEYARARAHNGRIKLIIKLKSISLKHQQAFAATCNFFERLKDLLSSVYFKMSIAIFFRL